jgi:hypothetical protein
VEVFTTLTAVFGWIALALQCKLLMRFTSRRQRARGIYSSKNKLFLFLNGDECSSHFDSAIRLTTICQRRAVARTSLVILAIT